MSEVAEKTAEVVADQVEDAIDGVVEVVEIVRNNPVALAVVGVLGLAAGAAGGYFFAAKRLAKQYEEQMEIEIAQTRDFYANLNKVDSEGVFVSPQDVLAARHGEEAVEAVRQYQGRAEAPAQTEEELIAEQQAGEPHDDIVDEQQIQRLEERTVRERADGKVEVKEKVETRQVFNDPGFDLEEELKFRTEDKPYIITHDEFYEGAKDYDTSTLTYYKVDDVLCDERDQPIEGVDDIVGEDHLVRFGSGSKDKNIVFVRNDKLGTDYEIIQSAGSYLEEVLGMPEEESGTMKHSDQRDRRRALRRDEG